MNYERWTKCVIYSGPAGEPLSFADMQAQLRLDSSDEQTLVESYIKAARVKVEEITGRKLIEQTWDLYYDSLHDPLALPFAPLLSIGSVKYQDGNNTQQTVDTAIYETAERNGRPLIRLKYNQSWPTTLGHADDVVVRATFGYESIGSPAAGTTEIPEPVLQVMRWYASQLFERRETPADADVARLLFEYVLNEF